MLNSIFFVPIKIIITLMLRGCESIQWEKTINRIFPNPRKWENRTLERRKILVKINNSLFDFAVHWTEGKRMQLHETTV